MRSATRAATATVLATVVATLTACGGQPAAARDAADPSETLAASCTAEDGPLRIYLNPWGETLSERFTADTGIPTEIADLGGGEILARIAAEANNPQWDVVVLDGHGSLQSLADQDMLLTGWTSESRANLTAEADRMAPEDNAWLPVSEHAAGLIAYNTDLVPAEDAPQSWSELSGPVGFADPAVAAPAYPVVSWFFQDMGTEAAQAWFSELIDSGMRVYPKNGPLGQALVTGEVPVAALQEQHVYQLMQAGDPVDIVWPEEGALGVVRAAAISADTPRPCASQKFLDWLLTPETMTYLMAEGGDDGVVTPLVEGTDTSSLPPERPAETPLLITDARFAADNEADIKDWFADELAR